MGRFMSCNSDHTKLFPLVYCSLTPPLTTTLNFLSAVPFPFYNIFLSISFKLLSFASEVTPQTDLLASLLNVRFAAFKLTFLSLSSTQTIWASSPRSLCERILSTLLPTSPIFPSAFYSRAYLFIVYSFLAIDLAVCVYMAMSFAVGDMFMDKQCNH